MTSLCHRCGSIPDHLELETLHGPEQMPPEVGQLCKLAWTFQNTWLAVCSACSAWYRVYFDHDSESGVGYGYTDEARG